MTKIPKRLLSELKKLFPRLFTIILFAATILLLLLPVKWSFALTTGCFLLLNFIIILGAIYFGTKGVLSFGLFSLLAGLIHSLRISAFAFPPILLLVATTCILYFYCLKIDTFARRINTELSNIEEEKNVLVVELEHLRLENTSLKQKLHRYTALKGLTETLSSTPALDKTLSLITAETLRIVDKSNVCLLYLVDKEKQELNLASSKSLAPHFEVKRKKGDIFDSRVFKQHTPLMVKDAKKDFRFNIQESAEALRRICSLISAPLIRENKIRGILRLDNTACEAYETDDLRLLDIISDLSAVAIENTLLYQETQKLAITDGLSGLFVHRHFQERFDQELSRALLTNSQFAFLMLDIDGFKSYNDKFGHIAGDIVLRKIAQLICASTNPGDIVARYGGEEFGVLLVDTPKSEALKTAERIRARVEKERFILRRKVSEVRISGGIVFFPEGAQAKEELIEKADQALYKAKLQGKNRICTF